MLTACDSEFGEVAENAGTCDAHEPGLRPVARAQVERDPSPFLGEVNPRLEAGVGPPTSEGVWVAVIREHVSVRRTAAEVLAATFQHHQVHVIDDLRPESVARYSVARREHGIAPGSAFGTIKA